MNTKTLLTFIIVFLSTTVFAQLQDPYSPDSSNPKVIQGMKLSWNDEFNINGKPDAQIWRYEKGYVRNNEIQWYQPENANCTNGLLVIEGKREQFNNPNYDAASTNCLLLQLE